MSVEAKPVLERKTIRISEKRQLTIPQKFYDKLGFASEAECILRGNELILRPVQTQSSGEFDEQILADLIAQGLSGQELLDAFKETRKKIRPAVEKLLAEARQYALTPSDVDDFADIFGAEDDR